MKKKKGIEQKKDRQKNFGLLGKKISRGGKFKIRPGQQVP